MGHRGAAALEPENTLRAFRKGMECGADAVEFDVRRTKNGKLAVIHDADISRTTHAKGLLKEFTLEELKRLDAGKGETIPELKEALMFLKDKNTGIVLEIKEDGTERQIAEEVKSSGIEAGRITFVSFSPASVRAIKSLVPKARAGIIFSRLPENIICLALGCNAEIILPKHIILDKELVQKAHRHGLLVYTWTLNGTEEIREAIELGVDGFASDNPCMARELLRKNGY